jgi:hypothetical protein
MKEAEQVARVRAILIEAQRTGRYEKVGLIVANCPAIRELVGFREDQLERIKAARAKVLFERKQLNPTLTLPD